MVQILEASALGKVVHALMIDRGPLWFEGYGSFEHFTMFTEALLKEFPRRMFRRYRFIPEMEQTPALDSFMTGMGFTGTGQPYETICLDLSQSEDDLRAQLKKNWRAVLSKAEKENFQIDWTITTANFKSFLSYYAADKAEKGYEGPTAETLMALARAFIPGGCMLYGRALKDRQERASILLLKHGAGATYQVGWTSEYGRKTGAQTLLLWRGMLELKNQGVTEFDLGGINDDTAKGVKKFKQGMGGRIVRSGALYIG